jgi:hypothetical protein
MKNREGGIRTGDRGGCPPRGEHTRGLAPSVGARAVSARATSNAHPLRHMSTSEMWGVKRKGKSVFDKNALLLGQSSVLSLSGSLVDFGVD